MSRTLIRSRRTRRLSGSQIVFPSKWPTHVTSQTSPSFRDRGCTTRESKSNGSGDMEQSWSEGMPPGHDLVTNPTCPQPGFTLPRRQSQMRRISLPMGCDHITCLPLRREPSDHKAHCWRVSTGGLRCLHQAGPDAVEWLSKLSMKLWECSKRATTTDGRGGRMFTLYV